jgi:hypothetical protein
MPRTDYSVHVITGVAGSDTMLTGNLDSADTTIPAHRLELAYPTSQTNSHMVIQRETPPNSFLNGRLRIFYKITSRAGNNFRLYLVARSSLPTQTFYAFFLDSTTGTSITIGRFIAGTFTALASGTVDATLAIGKGTFMAEVTGFTLKAFANIVPLTDPDANAYIPNPPLIVTVSNTSITTAGKFGFGLQAVSASGAVEIDRFHVFEIT